MNTRSWLTSMAALCFGCAALPLAAQQGVSDYSAQPFTLTGVQSRIEPADLDGDGLSDLLTAGEREVSAYFQNKEGGFDFSEADARLELPGEAAGWALAPLPGAQGMQLLALVDGREIRSWPLAGRSFGESSTVLAGLRGFLPAGVYAMDFVRDINGDGRRDLIVPGASELTLYLAGAEGGYGDGLQIQSRLINYSRLRGDADLADNVGQRVRIPQLNIRDLNADGQNDLITSSEERVDVFLADANGEFPGRASYSVDLEALEERVGEVDFDNVDYSNLSGLLAHTYDVQLEDIDGDRIEDLLLREGGKLTLFGGTENGMNMDQPRQILKSGGNVLGTILRDEDGDGLKDLWLMRLEDVSLGNLFIWLAVSGSVDVETFVYKNSGERFSSRPHRKLTLSIRFPSILRSVDLVTEAMDPEETGDMSRVVRAQLDGDQSGQDLAVLRQQWLAVFLNAIEEDDEAYFLGLSDYSRDKDEYVYDLGEVLENPASSANGDWERIRGSEADLRIPFKLDGFEVDSATADLVAWEMNGDGRDDFFVLTKREEDRVEGLLLLSE